MGQTVEEGKIYLSKDDTFSQSFEISIFWQTECLKKKSFFEKMKLMADVSLGAKNWSFRTEQLLKVILFSLLSFISEKADTQGG